MLIPSSVYNTNGNCFCSDRLQYEVCSVWEEKRHNLNFKSKQFCLSYLPGVVKTHGVNLVY